jgi:hypothetical protein
MKRWKIRKSIRVVSFFLALLLPFSVPATERVGLFTTIGADYSNFYSSDRLYRLGFGFAAMGLVANSRIDRDLQDGYRERYRSDRTNDFSAVAKTLGEGLYLIPIAAAAGAVHYFDSSSDVGYWGLNTLRAYSTGLPAMWAMQVATGASRPKEGSGSSSWRPFKDNNGVSGHAFVGAVPFLTIARMVDSGTIKSAAYFASSLAAWSRINDDSHFTSQAVLGWFMAYESVGAVSDTNEKRWVVLPVVGKNYLGLMMSNQW